MSFLNLKSVSALVTVVSLVATTASATCMNCDPVTGTPPTTPSTRTLSLDGLATIGGDVASQFMGTVGLNDASKIGNTRLKTKSTLAGFCMSGPCDQVTTVEANMLARERGEALTMAGSDESGDDVGIQNGGVFQAMTGLGITYGDNVTNVKGTGLALFGNEGTALAAGDHVLTEMVSTGNGNTKSTLGIDGVACPTCADFEGGQSSAANARMKIFTQALGGTSGKAVRIKNTGVSSTGSVVGTMFDQPNG